MILMLVVNLHQGKINEAGYSGWVEGGDFRSLRWDAVAQEVLVPLIALLISGFFVWRMTIVVRDVADSSI